MLAIEREFILLGSMMSDGSQVGPPPGWYTDASSAGQPRWWDGAAWAEPPTETTSAAPATRAMLRASRVPAVAPAAVPSEPAGPVELAGVVEPAGRAESAAQAERVAGVEPASRVESPAGLEPAGRGELAGVVEPAGLAESAPRVEPVSRVEPAGPVEPAAGAAPAPRVEPTRAPRPQAMPDQIGPRRPAPIEDRPPEPLVYQPVSSASISDMRPPTREADAPNVPARAAVVLVVLAAVGGAVAFGWLANADRALAGLVSLVSVALAAGAVFLAIAGLVVAGQRRTKKTLSAVALAVAAVLAVALGALATQQALAMLA